MVHQSDPEQSMYLDLMRLFTCQTLFSGVNKKSTCIKLSSVLGMLGKIFSRTILKCLLFFFILFYYYFFFSRK